MEKLKIYDFSNLEFNQIFKHGDVYHSYGIYIFKKRKMIRVIHAGRKARLIGEFSDIEDAMLMAEAYAEQYNKRVHPSLDYRERFYFGNGCTHNNRVEITAKGEESLIKISGNFNEFSINRDTKQPLSDYILSLELFNSELGKFVKFLKEQAHE